MAVNMSKVTLLITLGLFGTCTLADLTIQLDSLSDTITNSLTWSVYQDLLPFKSQYANIRSSPFGLVHQPYPSNACSYIEPLPFEIVSKNVVFALVDDYPSCVTDMIDNVRNAGYELIITSSIDNTQRTVTKEVQNSGFPVAVVSEEYAAYLGENVTVENLDEFDSYNVIVAKVTGSILTSVVTMACAMSILLFICCCCCCFCLLCCRNCSRERDVERHLEEIEDRRRTFEQVQRRERYARQELIESILRQLAELQVDLRLQVPLGEQATKRLPTRRYQTGQEKMDLCAICVDDFTDGDNLRVLPCEHVFHSECVDEWLINHSSLCPLCKMEVPRRNVSRDGNGPIEINNFTTDDDSTTTDYDGSSDNLIPNIDRSEPRNGAQRYGSV